MNSFARHYLYDVDRTPIKTYLTMCDEMERMHKDIMALRGQVEQLQHRNEVQAQIIRDEAYKLDQETMDEIDRNARAFGWEIGHGAILVGGTVCTSDNNPFMSKDWKKEMGFE